MTPIQEQPLPPTRRAKKSVGRIERENERTAVTISTIQQDVIRLQEQEQQTYAQFTQLGEKFDRIIDRVEQLTINTTQLITRHDTQIQVLQQQQHSQEIECRAAQTVANQMQEKIGALLTAKLAEMDHKYEKSQGELRKRIETLEGWRLMLIGGGFVLGWLLTQIWHASRTISDLTK